MTTTFENKLLDMQKRYAVHIACKIAFTPCKNTAYILYDAARKRLAKPNAETKRILMQRLDGVTLEQLQKEGNATLCAYYAAVCVKAIDEDEIMEALRRTAFYSLEYQWEQFKQADPLNSRGEK